MSKYLRIASRIFNTPLAVTQDKLDIVSSSIGLKILTGEDIASTSDVGIVGSDKSTQHTYVANVFDSLVAKGGFGNSGFTSYEEIQSNISSAVAKGTSKVVLHIDSPGGEVAGLFSLTDYIASLPEKYGVETSAVIDGTGASAAYALAASAQRVYSTESSISGSIGVIMSLVDQTKLDEKLGIKYHILRSKEEKALGNSHEEISPEILSKYQVLLDDMDSIFNQKMVDYREALTLDAINSFKGNVFLAKDALKLGLVDAIVPSLSTILENDNDTLYSFATTSTGTATMNLEETKTELSEAKTSLVTALAEITTLKAAITQASIDAQTTERTRCTTIIATGKTLHMSEDQVSKYIANGIEAEVVTDIFTGIKEGIDDAAKIDTATGADTTILPKTETDTSAKIEVDGQTVSAQDVMDGFRKRRGTS